MRGLIPLPWGAPLADMGQGTDPRFNRFFGSDRWPMLRMPWTDEAMRFAPRADMVETPGAYEVTAELPGLKPEEFNVEFRDGALWITGEKHDEKAEEGKTFHRVERRYGKFERMFAFAGRVHEDAITADFKDGVLKIVIPKAEEVKPKPITVKT
jgi:HSP20 family protein